MIVDSFRFASVMAKFYSMHTKDKPLGKASQSPNAINRWLGGITAIITRMPTVSIGTEKGC